MNVENKVVMWSLLGAISSLKNLVSSSGMEKGLFWHHTKVYTKNM